MKFTVNNQEWNLVFVKPNSINLMRSDGSITIGMTDNNTKSVYINDRLNNYLFDKCLAHELCHVFCFSYDIYMPIEQEEYLADWISRYGRELIYLLDDLMQTLKKAYIA
jgi:Zn-dependent peptidase ImmA (M78 family)